jgi:hypothetical protein
VLCPPVQSRHASAIPSRRETIYFASFARCPHPRIRCSVRRAPRARRLRLRHPPGPTLTGRRRSRSRSAQGGARFRRLPGGARAVRRNPAILAEAARHFELFPTLHESAVRNSWSGSRAGHGSASFTLERRAGRSHPIGSLADSAVGRARCSLRLEFRSEESRATDSPAFRQVPVLRLRAVAAAPPAEAQRRPERALWRGHCAGDTALRRWLGRSPGKPERAAATRTDGLRQASASALAADGARPGTAQVEHLSRRATGAVACTLRITGCFSAGLSLTSSFSSPGGSTWRHRAPGFRGDAARRTDARCASQQLRRPPQERRFACCMARARSAGHPTPDQIRREGTELTRFRAPHYRRLSSCFGLISAHYYSTKTMLIVQCRCASRPRM